MRFTRTKAAAAVAALALTLTACGDDGGTPDVEVADAPEFEAGTTMARLSEAGAINVGTKFDQPGFGLEGLSGDLEGFDVEVAKIIAGAMGISPDNITFTEAPSEVREQVIEDGDVDMVVATYTINDERAERITFAGPYYTAGQQLMVESDNDSVGGPEDLADPDIRVCSVTGSTPSEQIKEYLADDSQLVLFDTYEKCADSLSNGQVDVGHHRQRDPAGVRRRERRRLQARRRAVHRRALRHRHRQGRRGVLRVHQRDPRGQRGRLHRGLGGHGRSERGHRDPRAARAQRVLVS